MSRVASIELDRNGWSLRVRPKQVPFSRSVIGGEAVKQLLNLIAEDVLEEVACQAHKLLRIRLAGDVDVLLDCFQAGTQHSRLSLQLQGCSLNVLARVFKIFDALNRSVSEDSLEVVSSPLDSVIDLIGEVLESAKRDRLLRRILGFAVRLRLEGND